MEKRDNNIRHQTKDARGEGAALANTGVHDHAGEAFAFHPEVVSVIDVQPPDGPLVGVGNPQLLKHIKQKVMGDTGNTI